MFESESSIVVFDLQSGKEICKTSLESKVRRSNYTFDHVNNIFYSIHRNSCKFVNFALDEFHTLQKRLVEGGANSDSLA